MDSSHSDTDLNGEPSEPLVLGRRMDTLHNNNNKKEIKMRKKFRNRAFFSARRKADGGRLCGKPVGDENQSEQSVRARDN